MKKPQHRIVAFRVQEKPTDEAVDPIMITLNNKTQNNDQKRVKGVLAKNTHEIPIGLVR